MADVLMFHTPDGGEIEVKVGRVRRATLETALYLSLFGGNKRDDGTAATEKFQWWGNHTKRRRRDRYRSETQAMIEALPLIPANLRRIEDAVLRDIHWMEDVLGARTSTVATIPRINHVHVDVNVELDGESHLFGFDFAKESVQK